MFMKTQEHDMKCNISPGFVQSEESIATLRTGPSQKSRRLLHLRQSRHEGVIDQVCANSHNARGTHALSEQALRVAVDGNRASATCQPS